METFANFGGLTDYDIGVVMKGKLFDENMSSKLSREMSIIKRYFSPRPEFKVIKHLKGAQAIKQLEFVIVTDDTAPTKRNVDKVFNGLELVDNNAVNLILEKWLSGYKDCRDELLVLCNTLSLKYQYKGNAYVGVVVPNRCNKRTTTCNLMSPALSYSDAELALWKSALRVKSTDVKPAVLRFVYPTSIRLSDFLKDYWSVTSSTKLKDLIKNREDEEDLLTYEYRNERILM